MIIIDDKTRIVKTANSWDIQVLVGKKWITKYYYTTALSAVNGAFHTGISGRKNVNIKDIEQFIKDELSKFLKKIKVEDE